MSSVCVLGGSLSGLECAGRLALAGFEVSVFRTLHDPSRSFRDLHPIYEYCPRSIRVPNSPQGSVLLDVLEAWSTARLVEEDSSRFGALQPDGKFVPSPLARRIRSKSGGFFNLLESLASNLPNNAHDRKEILAGITRTDTGVWEAMDLEGNKLGTYHTIICSYDYFLRGTRKAAVRALLEDALPVSAPVMRSVAGATDSCVFALIVKADGSEEVPFDVAHVEGVPELAVILRNGGPHQVDCGQERRGLPFGVSWTLVATPEWTDSVRPNATSRWNKDDVSRQMLAAFARVSGMRARALRPPYHWGGYASLTYCVAESFAFDASSCLGFVGDFFVGHGAEEALASGAAMADHIIQQHASNSIEALPRSVFPQQSDWKLREIRECDEEISVLLGRPAATEDHAWPTIRQLGTGTLARGQRCMDRYRGRRIWEQDVAWLQASRTSTIQGDGRDQHNTQSRGHGYRRGYGQRCGRGASSRTSTADASDMHGIAQSAHLDERDGNTCRSASSVHSRGRWSKTKKPTQENILL